MHKYDLVDFNKSSAHQYSIFRILNVITMIGYRVI